MDMDDFYNISSCIEVTTYYDYKKEQEEFNKAVDYFGEFYITYNDKCLTSAGDEDIFLDDIDNSNLFQKWNLYLLKNSENTFIIKNCRSGRLLSNNLYIISCYKKWFKNRHEFCFKLEFTVNNSSDEINQNSYIQNIDGNYFFVKGNSIQSNKFLKSLFKFVSK